jgi:hypothetical protein
MPWRSRKGGPGVHASCDDRNAFTGTAEILVPVRKARGKVPAEFAEHFGRWLNQE